MTKKGSAKDMLHGVIGKKSTASDVLYGGKKAKKPNMGWL